MKKIFVAAEFDPFHNGHKYLLDKIKAAYPGCATVSAMSGACTQRGGFAIFQKNIRAAVAAMNGLDLCVQLPFVYAAQGAEMFAAGAVYNAAACGCEVICFGAGCDDITRFEYAAELLDRPGTAALLTKYVKNNMPYPAARIAALSSVSGTDFSFLSEPNDILALEYVRAIRKTGANISARAFYRAPAEDDAAYAKVNNDASASPVLSASALRAMLAELRHGNNITADRATAIKAKITALMPTEAYDSAAGTENAVFRLPVNRIENYAPVFAAQLITRGSEPLRAAAGADPSAAKRLCDNAPLLSTGLDEYMRACLTKCLTAARIRRSLINYTLGYTDEELAYYRSHAPGYIRVLSLGENGAAVIRGIKQQNEAVKVLTRLTESAKLSAREKRAVELDIKAQALYDIFMRENAADMKYTPFVAAKSGREAGSDIKGRERNGNSE